MEGGRDLQRRLSRLVPRRGGPSTVAFTGTDIVRIEDGKFAEYWLNVDSLFFMQQIGVHEVPALA